MQPETEARINSVVARARRGELAAAADEAEALLNSAHDQAPHISAALHRQLSPHAVAEDVKRRVGVTTFFSQTAKLAPELQERLDQEKAAVKTFYRRLLTAAEGLLGPAHRAAVDLRDCLITVCDVMEDRQEAVRACEQALAVAEAHPDPGQESSIRYRQWLSRLYRQAGQVDQAESVYDNIRLCRHLQPLLEALRASGAKIRDLRNQGPWRRFVVDTALDCDELIRRHSLPDCVQVCVENFGDPHWDEEHLLKGFVCREDDHGIFAPGTERPNSA
jgi:hypothetical protein